MTKESKPSKVEIAKQNSRYLRGTIGEVLTNKQIDKFEHDDTQLLKFHGIYQQDDRDKRKEAKTYNFMIRTKLPGGRMTSAQYLALEALATEHTPTNSLRITVRQTFQFHGVIKDELKLTMAGINETLITTLGACGDVQRNVMCTPAPFCDKKYVLLRQLANDISRQVAPETGAYFEMWLDEEKVLSHKVKPHEESFYGETYLPRKFKVAVTLPEDNSVDAYTQDCALIPIIENDQIKAINVIVGGGLGLSHGNAHTYARLGSHLGSIAPEHALDTVKTICAIFRDYGDRTDRKHARLKYVVEEWGIEKFKDEFKNRAQFSLNDWISIGPMQIRDYLGVTDQGDGKFCYGVWVENGRVIDRDGLKIKSAFREIATKISPTVILTPNQSILFADLSPDQIEPLKSILQSHGIKPVEDIKAVHRYAMACPALPTCGLALAEAERYFPDLLNQLEDELSQWGLEDDPLTIRMTGCPNGCARPYTADLAFVGRKPGVYDIFVGGRLAGDRMVELYADSVSDQEIVVRLRPLFKAWHEGRRTDESFGDFYNRVYAKDHHRTILTGAK